MTGKTRLEHHLTSTASSYSPELQCLRMKTGNITKISKFKLLPQASWLLLQHAKSSLVEMSWFCSI